MEETDYNLTASVVIPCLDESELIEQTLCAVFALQPKPVEIIVVDGGSQDDTMERVGQLAKQAIVPIRIYATESADRGAQMNVGAAASEGDLICFLHADTAPPVDLIDRIRLVLGEEGRAICAVQSKYTVAGRTGMMISSLNFLKTFLIPLIFFPRCFFIEGFRLFFGDQLICSRRRVWQDVGGFREGGIMEDADFCLAVARLGLGRAKLILNRTAITSGRRCEDLGFWSCMTTYLYLTFRWAFRQPVDRWKDGYENYQS